MKMVISQLEGILIELKDVAKELREVRFEVYMFGGEAGRGCQVCLFLDSAAFN